MGRILLSIYAVALALTQGGPADARQPEAQPRPLEAQSASEVGSSPAPQPSQTQTAVEKAVAAEKRDEEDLRAQQRMAEAAEAQAADVDIQTLWFGLSVILTGIASIVSLFALMVAIGTGRRELRAYVMLETVTLFSPSQDPKYARSKKKVPDIPWTRIVLRNFGPTPARNVLHWAAITLIRTDAEDTLSQPDKLERISEGATAPNGYISKTLSLGGALTPDEILGLASGEMSLFVHGKLSYRDAFAWRRTTRYRLKYHGIWPPPPGCEVYYCDRGNTVT